MTGIFWVLQVYLIISCVLLFPSSSVCCTFLSDLGYGHTSPVTTLTSQNIVQPKLKSQRQSSLPSCCVHIWSSSLGVRLSGCTKWDSISLPPGVPHCLPHVYTQAERGCGGTYILPLRAFAFCSSSRFLGGVGGVIPSFRQPVGSFRLPR